MYRSLFRPQALRASRHSIRHNSTQQKAADVASKAQEAASNTASKAQETASAAATKAQAAVSGAAQRVSGITSRIMSLQEPIVYWSKVTGQVAKQVYLKEGMSPPSMAQLETTYKSLLKNLSSKDLLSTVKRLSTRDALKLGADGLVIYGFFVFGEMIGRRSLVGYDV